MSLPQPVSSGESATPIYAPVNRSSEELEMRRIMVPELRRRWPGGRIVHELGLRYSTNVIDVAVITPTQIIGVEIKSSRDVLDRLEGQVKAFAPICTQVIVALAPRWCAGEGSEYLSPRRRPRAPVAQHDALDLLRRIGASNVEAWLCCATTGSAERHRNSWSAQCRFPWAYQLLEMLRVSELAQIAFRHGIAPPTRHDRLVAALHDQLRGAEVVPAVCRILRSRVSPHPLSDPEVSP